MTEHEYDCVTCCSLADQLDDALTELEQVKSDHAVLCERSALWFDMKDGKEFQTMWNLLRKTPSQAYVDLKAELEQVKSDHAELVRACEQGACRHSFSNNSDNCPVCVALAKLQGSKA